MRFVLGSQVAEKSLGMPSNRPRCMATKGRDSPLGLLGAAPQRPSSKGCWARGGGQGCAWGGPSPPCYSATARQCSSCNVLGQDKREHHPSSHCQSWPEDSPKTSERKSLRSSRNYLLQAQGGRPEAGRGCWRFFIVRPDCGGVTFKTCLMDGNPASAFGEQTQAPQEMGRSTNRWRFQRLSGLSSWTAVARPRECLLVEHCRACCPHPLWSQRQQP